MDMYVYLEQKLFFKWERFTIPGLRAHWTRLFPHSCLTVMTCLYKWVDRPTESSNVFPISDPKFGSIEWTQPK
jgi:hypothetical protein